MGKGKERKGFSKGDESIQASYATIENPARRETDCFSEIDG